MSRSLGDDARHVLAEKALDADALSKLAAGGNWVHPDDARAVKRKQLRGQIAHQTKPENHDPVVDVDISHLRGGDGHHAHANGRSQVAGHGVGHLYCNSVWIVDGEDVVGHVLVLAEDAVAHRQGVDIGSQLDHTAAVGIAGPCGEVVPTARYVDSGVEAGEVGQLGAGADECELGLDEDVVRAERAGDGDLFDLDEVGLANDGGAAAHGVAPSSARVKRWPPRATDSSATMPSTAAQ